MFAFTGKEKNWVNRKKSVY